MYGSTPPPPGAPHPNFRWEKVLSGANRLLVVFTMKYNTYYRQVNNFDVLHLSRWDFFFIERFVCCMTHEENLSIQ